MPTASKKDSRSTVVESPKKTSATKKPTKTTVGSGSDPYTVMQIDELKARLRLFTEPDFSFGDFWPRLDRRFYGHLPDLIHRVLAVLEVRFPRPTGTHAHRCQCHDHDE